jgi:hypothetical protein
VARQARLRPRRRKHPSKRNATPKAVEGNLGGFCVQRGQLEGRLQQRYGFAKDQARKDVETWFSSLK